MGSEGRCRIESFFSDLITFSLMHIIDRLVDSPQVAAQSVAPFVVTACLAYVPMTHYGQKWMESRPPFRLRTPFILWNFVLSLLSLAGVVTILWNDPRCVVNRVYPIFQMTKWTKLTQILFCLSKVLEFGDTAFLVLKKKPVIFLHTYHHVTVSLYCLHAVISLSTTSHLFGLVNLAVHAVMYAYYGLAVFASGSRILRSVRPWITRLQLSQMLLGVAVSINTIHDPATPASTLNNAYLCVAMYVSYAYLFGDFYIRNFLKGYNSHGVLWCATVVLAAIWGVATLTKRRLVCLALMIAATRHFQSLRFDLQWWNPLMAEDGSLRRICVEADQWLSVKFVASLVLSAALYPSLQATGCIWGLRLVIEAAFALARPRPDSVKQEPETDDASSHE